MYSIQDYAHQLQTIEETGIVIMRNVSQFHAYHTDILCPHMSFMHVERGSASALYDMKEITQHTNELACLMPGHILHPLESSDDFLATIIVLSHRLHQELQFHVFSHDYDKFNLIPICSLTTAQSQRMLSFTEQLEAIAGHSQQELPNRDKMLLSLMAVGYEFLNLYRSEQFRHQRETRRNAGLFNRFCDLVIQHHRKSHEMQFYAEMLNLTPKYFTKIISSMSGGISPAEWIEQYLITQAKHLLSAQRLTVKETAYHLGFSGSSSFCRFFKRTTGLTPRQYNDSLNQ